MSLKALTWVMEQAPVDDPTSLLVLYALADRAHDDGTAAWPSQDWIAERARCSDRTVRRVLGKLEDQGIIKKGDPRHVAHIREDRRPTVWNLCMHLSRADTHVRADKMTGRTPRVERPDTGDQTTGHPGSNDRTQLCPTNRPEPSLNRPEPSVQNDRFDDFWTTYPKKVGKGQARKAYTTALKKVDAGTLMEKLELFTSHHEQAGTDKKFIPNASTWLNGERWDDELIPVNGERAASIDDVLSWRVSGSFEDEKQEVPF